MACEMATKKVRRTPKAAKRQLPNACLIPGPVPSRALGKLRVRPDPEHEQRAVREYVESQAPERVVHLEKVASERVYGKRHDVWDVHTNRRRWWVVTDPTNLYAQKDFPSLDYILSFHVGLMARVSSRQQKEATSGPERERMLAAWRRWEQAAEALDLAEEPEDFQAVGMRCRECLLELVQAASHPSMLQSGEEAPKRGDFVHWSEIVARTIARGEEIGSFLKSAAKATWQLVNWLTHAKNAVRMDGQIALNATNVVLGTFAMALLRHEQGAPDRCPSCSSYQVDVDYRIGVEGDDPVATFSVCSRCGWESPVPRDRNPG
jgi:hypothetical protein